MALNTRQRWRGQQVSARHERDVRQDLLANRITVGPGLRVSQTRAGTVISLAAQISRAVGSSAAASITTPFKLYQHTPDPANPVASDWRTFRVHTGLFLFSHTNQVFSCINDDASGSPINIIVPANSGYVVYIALENLFPGDTKFWGVNRSTAAIYAASGGWGGGPGTVTGAHWYFPLGTITTGPDVGFGAKTVTLSQYVSDTILLPFFIPDPAVSPNPNDSGCIAVLAVY